MDGERVTQQSDQEMLHRKGMQFLAEARRHCGPGGTPAGYGLDEDQARSVQAYAVLAQAHFTGALSAAGIAAARRSEDDGK